MRELRPLEVWLIGLLSPDPDGVDFSGFTSDSPRVNGFLTFSTGRWAKIDAGGRPGYFCHFMGADRA